jgi:hypothetical protein
MPVSYPYKASSAVRHGKAEIVVPVKGQFRGFQSLSETLEEPMDPRRRHHPHRVTDDRTVGPGFRARVVQIRHESEVGPERVLRHERDRETMGDREFRFLDGDLLHPLPRHAELVPDVEVGPRGEEGDLVDAALDAGFHILAHGARRGHYDRVEPFVCDRADASRLFLGDDRDPDVEDRDMDFIQDPCNLELLLRRVRHPGRLFPVAEGLLPYLDAFRDSARKPRFEEVVVDERLFCDGRSPATSGRIRP